MILDKIEVSYPRAILKYKVKFVESRQPTYIEFILLQLIINYGDRDQKLIKILEGELGINNSSLFQRAMRDLLNFNIIQTSEDISEMDFDKLLNVQLSNLSVSKILSNSFREGNFMISNIEKYLELKFVFDPLTKQTRIFKSIDWEKKVIDSQCVYKLFQREDINYKMKVEDIKSETLKLMKSEPMLFGENCKLVDVELMDNTPIDEIKNEIDIYYEFENIGYRTLVNFNEKKYVIDSESTDLIKYFNNDKILESEFITYVFDNYNKKIGEVMKGKIADAQNANLDSAVLMQDFPSKIKTFDFLFFNFNDLHSRSKFLERPKYIENSSIIFEYNINGDEVRIGYERKKILVATHRLKRLDYWKQCTIIYANFKKEMEAYNVEKVYVPSIKETIFVARTVDDFYSDLSEDLSETFSHIVDVFHTSLKFGDYDRVSLCIGLLFKLDEKQIVEKIMIERISADIAYAREYSAIKKSLSRYNLKEEIAFMENIVTNIFIENINKFDSNTFIKLLNKYNFVNRDNLLKLINKSNFDFAMDDLIAINTMLEKQAIDGWKINLNNSLTKYIKYLLENDDKNIFNNNSITLTGHMTFVSKYKKFVGDLKEGLQYPDLIESFRELTKVELHLIQSIDIEMFNKVEYLDTIGKLMNTPTKLFKQIILSYIKSDPESKVSQTKLLAYDFLKTIDEKVSKLIRPNTVSESWEINKAILKVSKSIELAEEIIGDEFKLNDCADIFYNWTFEIREDNAIKKYLELGGNKNE
jgi:hypothetical protein